VRYAVELARPARRALTDELPVKVATAAWELIDGALRDNPNASASHSTRPTLVTGWLDAAATASATASTRTDTP